MKRVFLLLALLVPVFIQAEPDLNLNVKINVPIRVQGFLTASFEPENLFSTLDLVLPKGDRFAGLIKLQAGRTKLNDLTSTPGPTAALAGLQIKVASVYSQTFGGYSSDGVVIEEDLRASLDKRIFFIKRFDIEAIGKYGFENSIIWSRTRPSVLVCKRKLNEVSIGGEYIFSGWNGGRYFVTRGGGFLRVDIAQRTRILLGGGRVEELSPRSYFFVEISNRLF